ncbi:MAG: IS21 family transposase [Bdellovibrionales bacterium]|nr:IS21 family transposase [Bdellovibrionales bacterium]
MAGIRIPMETFKEIMRLKSLGHSQRSVAKILGLSRNTVAKYWEDIPDKPEEIPPDWVKEIDFKKLKGEVKAGVPKKILYEEYSETIDLPTYQSFCKYLARHMQEEPKVTIRIERIPGHSVEVDYSGDSVPIISPASGTIKDTELFVGTMSFSGLIFAEFSFSQKMEDFIKSHNNMFQFLGGIPKFTIPDNCKTAVTKVGKHDPTLNRVYQDMCIHYGTIVDPVRVRKPQDKPSVERAVGIIQKDFFPRIRNKTYSSLFELNKDLKDFIKKKNNELMKDKGISRLDLFERERPCLKPLPEFPYEIYFFKEAKVHPDCHFQLDRNFYSVPYRFVGKKILIKYNSTHVLAFYNTEKIAYHKKMKGHAHYSTVEGHYPEKKIVDINFHLNLSLNMASKIGPNTSLLIKKLIEVERHPLKNLRKIQGILNLSKNFSTEAFEEACDHALTHNKLYYQFINRCAKNYRGPTHETIDKAPIREMELICLQGGRNE